MGGFVCGAYAYVVKLRLCGRGERDRDRGGRGTSVSTFDMASVVRLSVPCEYVFYVVRDDVHAGWGEEPWEIGQQRHLHNPPTNTAAKIGKVVAYQVDYWPARELPWAHFNAFPS